MISVLEDINSVVRCIELGATDYLTKPFNPVLLKARIDNCIEKSRYRAQAAAYLERIEGERRRADELLATVLPRSIVRALKRDAGLAPQRYEDVAVLFCDVVGFTAYSENNPPETVFAELEMLIDRFEAIAAKHGLDKIKTIGDAFMATANLLSPVDEPMLAAVACALDMVAAPQAVRADWAVRTGIDIGPVSAGIMGKTQFQFDVWGDTVNTAARIEEFGQPGSVNVSGRAWLHLRHQAQGRSLGFVDLKGKKKIEVIECTGLRR
jgi:class 3 adenylate cyclase